MQYQLKRSKRKTIAISFDGDGNLIVKAPTWLATREIEKFVVSKSQWIEDTAKRLEDARKKQMSTRLKLESGAELYYLGERRTLTVLREARSRGRAKQVLDKILVWVPYEADYEYVRQVLEKWYRKEATQILSSKVQEFAERLDVSYCDIRIKDQKSRWGSCSSKGNLNFNWRIIMAPEPVCDYVVIHELCHLIHMDHSPTFWSEVERLCPAHKQYRKWLKDNATQLYLF